MADPSALTDDELFALRERLLTKQEQASAPVEEPIFSDQELLDSYMRRKAAPAAAPRKPINQTEDFWRSLGRGGIRGVNFALGASGDVLKQGGDLVRNATGSGAWGDAAEAFASQLLPGPIMPPGLQRPTSEQLNATTADKIQAPQTLAGEYAQTGGEFASAAIFPGSALTRAARVAVPAAASETAGQITKGTSAEPYARFAGALLGGFAAEPAISRLPTLTDKLPRFAPREGVNTLGAFPGNVKVVPPPKKTETVRMAVRGATDALLKRGGITSETLPQRAAELRVAGGDPLLAQISEPTVQRAATLASLPGKTPQLAKTVLKGKRGELIKRGFSALDEMAGSKTRLDAREGLKNKRLEESPEWNRVLAQPVAKNADIDLAMSRLTPDDTAAIESAIGNFAIRRGINPDTITEAQRLHYLKRGLSQRIGDMRREGLKADELRDLVQVKNILVRGMEKAIPGYARVNARWKGIESSDDAIDFGADAISTAKSAMRPDELKAALDAMSPVERSFARLGARNELNRLIATKSSDNVGAIIASPEMAAKIEVLFGVKAKPFLKKMERLEEDFADYNRMHPRAGSTTLPKAADMEDLAMRMPLSKEGAIDAGFNFARSRLTQPLFEHGRNLQGAELLQTLTPESEAALLRYLLEKEAARSAGRGANAAQAAAAAPRAVER